jgi:hypothetical protein
VAKAILVAQFLRARARWRLDSAGASALHVARSVVSLLDAAACLRDIPDDDPGIQALEAAGCFRGGVFDPGPEGAVIVRLWQLADEPSAGPADLLAELARAARRSSPAALIAPASPTPTIPRQPAAPDAGAPAPGFMIT